MLTTAADPRPLRRSPRRYFRLAAKYAGDMALLAAGYWLAYFIRFDGEVPDRFEQVFAATLPLVVLTKVILLSTFGLYTYFWRYTGPRELLDVAKAQSLAFLFMLADYAVASDLVAFPRSTIFFDWLLGILLLSGFRLLPRLLRENSVPTLARMSGAITRRRAPTATQNVVLYGAGELGATLARQIPATFGSGKRILGFIDDDLALKQMRIHGVPVLGDRSVLPQLSARQRIDEIIITISAISGKALQELAEHCRQFSPNVQVAPSLDELFLGKVHVSQMRDVQIEDLLGRECTKVPLDEEQLARFLGGKTILVTGAGGSIGSELCFQILKFKPAKIVLFGHGENSIYHTRVRLAPHANGTELEEVIGDITNAAKVERVFATRRPQVVFHAAAHKHVPLMELNPDEAVMNNIVGTQHVLDAAHKHRAEKVVCISSDKAVNPTSVMGCCKRVSELLVQSQGFSRTVSCAVRFGNVLGSRGSVIPLFKKQIAEGGPVTITDPEIRRYFMTIPEAVLLVLQAGALSCGGEIFLLEMGEPMRIVDLAKQMIRLSGLAEDSIPIRFVGLRPGEKMNEELSLPYERRLATALPKLHRLESDGALRGDLRVEVERLKTAAAAMDFDAIHALLKGLVPEYEPTGYPRPVAAAHVRS